MASCGELAGRRPHRRHKGPGRGGDGAGFGVRACPRYVVVIRRALTQHRFVMRRPLPIMAAALWLVMAAPVLGQEPSPEGSAAPAGAIAQPDPAVPAPDPAPKPTDAARTAAPGASEGGGSGTSAPARTTPSGKTTSPGGTTSGGSGGGAGSASPRSLSTPVPGTASSDARTGATAARREAKRSSTRSRREAAGSQTATRRGSAASSASAATAQATPASAARATGPGDPDRTALAGAALLALALAGGCLAAGLARAQRVGLGG